MCQNGIWFWYSTADSSTLTMSIDRILNKLTCIKVNFANLPVNPCLGRKLSNYHPNKRDLYENHLGYYCAPILLLIPFNILKF